MDADTWLGNDLNDDTLTISESTSMDGPFTYEWTWNRETGPASGTPQSGSNTLLYAYSSGGVTRAVLEIGTSTITKPDGSTRVVLSTVQWWCHRTELEGDRTFDPTFGQTAGAEYSRTTSPLTMQNMKCFKQQKR